MFAANHASELLHYYKIRRKCSVRSVSSRPICSDLWSILENKCTGNDSPEWHEIAEEGKSAIVCEVSLWVKNSSWSSRCVCACVRLWACVCVCVHFFRTVLLSVSCFMCQMFTSNTEIKAILFKASQQCVLMLCTHTCIYTQRPTLNKEKNKGPLQRNTYSCALKTKTKSRKIRFCQVFSPKMSQTLGPSVLGSGPGP